MKKISYLAGLIAVVALASCNPMKNTYNALDANPSPGSVTYTLQSADYAFVPKAVDSLPAKNLAFTSSTQAKADIPSILNYKFFKYANNSTAKITYKTGAYLTQPDSLYKDLTYTLVDPTDYYKLSGNTYNDFTAAQTEQWLGTVYPNALPNQQYVLTFNYYNGSATVKNTTLAFGFIGGTWTQLYLVPASGYAAFGRGTYNEFVSADAANLPTYLNGILKVDATVAATAKVGSIQYVSFNYYVSSKDYQRIIEMQYDGTNWNPVNSATAAFIKSSGTWVPDPSVYYTLTAADCTAIANSTIGGTALASVRTSLGKYDDFEMGTGEFTTALLNQAFETITLPAHFPNPTANINYNITFEAYTGKDVATTYTYVYDGTQWTAKQ